MKRTTTIGIALAVGILSAGALSVSAAETQAVEQASSNVTSIIKAKELELREQYAFDRIDTNRVAQLEAEISELRAKAEVPVANASVTTPAGAVYDVTTP